MKPKCINMIINDSENNDNDNDNSDIIEFQ